MSALENGQLSEAQRHQAIAAQNTVAMMLNALFKKATKLGALAAMDKYFALKAQPGCEKEVTENYKKVENLIGATTILRTQASNRFDPTYPTTIFIRETAWSDGTLAQAIFHETMHRATGMGTEGQYIETYPKDECENLGDLSRSNSLTANTEPGTAYPQKNPNSHWWALEEEIHDDPVFLKLMKENEHRDDGPPPRFHGEL